jgi:Rieske 2Fe-2S family protein
MESSQTAPGRLEKSLPRAAYLEPDFFAREREAIFWNQWFVAGRSDALAAPGAYRVVDIAGESVILVRAAGRLHAHLNVCRHRGSRLLCGSGEVGGAIVCPYHAWSYAPDGSLAAAPFVDREALPADARRLHRVGVAEWGGFIFVHLTPEAGAADAASLAAQLGGMRERVKRYPLTALRTAYSITYDVAANWKVVLENYNECYHCAGVHPELCRIVPAFKHNGGANLDWENGVPHRAGATTFTANGTTARAPFPGLDAYERVRHKGELVYPNLLLSLAADHVAAFTLWPVGPARTTIVCDFLFHPDELARADFDPRDATEFWDLVNRQDWRICESVQSGMTSRAFRFGYYAPLEDASLDIRRYVADRLGPGAVTPE